MIGALIAEIEAHIKQPQKPSEGASVEKLLKTEKTNAANKLLAILKQPQGVHQSITLNAEERGILRQGGLGAIMEKYAIAYLPEHFKLEVGNTALTSIKNKQIAIVIIPDGVTVIERHAFARCHNLATVIIPDGMTAIKMSAFSDCSNLTAAIIPDGVTTIGMSAFDRCHNLTTVVIPDSITTIEESTFAHCFSLTTIIIPGSVINIEFLAFYWCTNLITVTISDGCTTIDDLAFAYCTNLTTITIPDSITTIKKGAFSNSLKYVIVSQETFERVKDCFRSDVIFIDSNQLRLVSLVSFKGPRDQLAQYINPNSLPTEDRALKKDFICSHLSLNQVYYYLNTVSTMLLIGSWIHHKQQEGDQKILPNLPEAIWLLLAEYSLQSKETGPQQYRSVISVVLAYKQLRQIFNHKINTLEPSERAHYFLAHTHHSAVTSAGGAAAPPLTDALPIKESVARKGR